MYLNAHKLIVQQRFVSFIIPAHMDLAVICAIQMLFVMVSTIIWLLLFCKENSWMILILFHNTLMCTQFFTQCFLSPQLQGKAGVQEFTLIGFSKKH